MGGAGKQVREQLLSELRGRRQAGGVGTAGVGSPDVALVLKGLGAQSPRLWKKAPNCFLLLQGRKRK